MHRIGGKKIFLFGFIAVLLIGIPVTIYLVQRQQQTQTHAEKSTTVSFTPVSSAAAPIQKNVGDSIPLDIYVDPGKNLVDFVKLEIQYDPDKLALASPTAFVANTAVLPTVLEGPVYTPGKIAISYSVGPDPTKAIQIKTRIATVTFKALKNTPPGTPTLVSYGVSTQISSAGPNDQASENVLSSAIPANIVIGGAVVSPTTPVPTTPVPTTPVPTTPVPTTPVPTTPIAPTVVLTPTQTATSSANKIPVCSTLAVDRSPTGDAPLSLTFTANGTDADGTISKATFNFGDGQVADVTTGGGIGTASVSVLDSHTYVNPGTFTASAIMTDNASGISDSVSCKQSITVTASGSASVAPIATNPTIAPTGSVNTAIGIGALILTFIVGGGFLFFLL